MRYLIAASALALAAACTTSTEPADTVGASTVAAVPDTFALAMSTVDSLVAAGNEQIAIDRLTQLLGDPSLTDDEAASALLRRAELRLGDGNNVEGAIEDLEEIDARYPGTPQAEEANSMFTTAVMEFDFLTDQLLTGSLAPTEEFEVLFRLGRHQDAADLMLSRSLTPDNAYLLDMYQVGYLCDDAELTGPSYDLTSPDGSVRTVRFCEFGK